MWHIAFGGLENQFWLSSHCLRRTRESIQGFFTLPLEDRLENQYRGTLHEVSQSLEGCKGRGECVYMGERLIDGWVGLGEVVVHIMGPLRSST